MESGVKKIIIKELLGKIDNNKNNNLNYKIVKGLITIFKHLKKLI